ncbi:copper amine oxidase [Sphingobacterium rhinopitheci]|uniref:copper amine oxidase n=1 Tax=Sphingobacterium rhinopitheci TaxID=2781960 RepID=UPI001F51A41A|nr:copper amine oxidase [Sphingobacterium rhinopitheci]MCI0920404.1 copper amine oxidase [Sphingobacterium rhinopitheci]
MIKNIFSVALTSLLLNGVYAQTDLKKVSSILKNAKEGEVVLLDNFLDPNFKKIEYKQTIAPGPQFIISDDPEYIRLPEAIAMQEEVLPGAVRLYVYNVNGINEPQQMPRKINAVIKNLGKENLHLRMLKYSSQKPSTNYFQIGKQGLADYFASEEKGNVRVVKPGEVIAIDEAFDKHIVKYDELVHGLYEFVVDQPAQISVLQFAPEKTAVQAFSQIDTVIPFSHVNAGRGIFPVSNYKIVSKDTLLTTNGVSQLVVADGIDDPWITGTIGADKQDAKNAGNYGVLYDTNIKWKSTDGKGLALITWNSRSADNQWCGGMGLTMELFDNDNNKSVVQFPSDRLVTKAAPEAILLKIYKPDPTKDIQEINFTYSPPGASCLPTPLILVPIDLKK